MIELSVPKPTAGINDGKIFCTVQFGKNLDRLTSECSEVGA